ncbi:amino acid ABC transporter substrate-binding protein [Deinococcus psychrotolerans]|uniref:Amino acid ABC transporter substrate-binding protein n=1 Tax=Deinococcus psychrotolerans TaxID=2489213 RepID=A0A3G8YKR0_9DEIO|nr:ABC transporter substrate-binding protein [Deinococcus psychrotolerans]AZI43154.1 amino acid ABC transporter substrate-binding protein [Deinococcus psychrotolerans]
MSTLFRSGLLLSLCSLMILPLAQARTLRDIKKEGVLHVNSLELPPFSYKTADGYTGFETELITMLASDLGLKIDFSPMLLDTIVSDLKEGRADAAVGGLGITSTRENQVGFTRPFLCAGMSVVSRDPAIQTRFDLENKTVGVLSGSTIQSFVQKLPFPKKAVVFATVNDLIYAIATGKVDATLGYKVSGPIMTKLYPKAGVLYGPVQWSIPVGAMLSDGDNSLRLALNGALAKSMQDGRYAQLSAKYFGENLRCKA